MSANERIYIVLLLLKWCHWGLRERAIFSTGNVNVCVGSIHRAYGWFQTAPFVASDDYVTQPHGGA